MFHNITPSRRPYPSVALASQRGSALVIGIFIITVMFLLAAALMSVLDDADQQVNLEVWGTRALFTANSGADTALAQLFPLTATDDTTSSCSKVSSSWTPPNAPGFHGCSVALSCEQQTLSGMTQYLIRSTATCSAGQCDSGSNSDAACIRVNRSVEVQARD